MTGPLPAGATCGRLRPYAVHEVRSAGGRVCGRPAVDRAPDGAPRCAVHRGVDSRVETNRANAARRRELLRRR